MSTDQNQAEAAGQVPAVDAPADGMQSIIDHFGFDPSNPEPLHPDLQPWVSEHKSFPVLKHPLVFDVPYMQAMNALANKRYVQKLEYVQEAVAERDFYTYVFLHERPFRLEAFSDIMGELDDQAYWELLGAIWTDSENIWQEYDAWRVLLTVERPGREYMMEEDERAAFAALPERLTVYRGWRYNDYEHSNVAGLSWTLERERAEWFARRHARADEKPMLATGVVNRDDVLAHFTGRREAEIVVLPENVHEVVTEEQARV